MVTAIYASRDAASRTAASSVVGSWGLNVGMSCRMPAYHRRLWARLPVVY